LGCNASKAMTLQDFLERSADRGAKNSLLYSDSLKSREIILDGSGE
jgi:hypothetical protein